MHHSFLDRHSDLDSLIHELDPRIKIMGFAVFILSIIFTSPDSFFLFTVYGMILFMMIILSRIPLSFLLKRSLVVIPFVVVIAAFIPFIKKGEVIGGYSLGALKLTITYDGLMVFWNVIVKSYLCALCMILLASSTKFGALLGGMQKLRCPALIVMVLSFMYRYIFVIEDEREMMKQAKASRTVGGSRWFHIRTLANVLGSLFVRSYERGEAVYLAMRCRGFDGTVRTANELKFSGTDVVFLLVLMAALGTARLLWS